MAPNNGTAAFLLPEDDFWIGFGNGTDGAVSIEEDTVYTQPIQATTFVLNQNITLSTTRKTPIVIKATQSITVNGTISADGKGYTYQEDNNYFNLSYSTQNVQGSIGISGGGSSGGGAGKITWLKVTSTGELNMP